MAIEINNNTVIRLIVRRGSQSDLDFATLAQGELGYAVDTKRLFIGMNNSQGIAGVTVAGNKYLGAVPRASIQNAFYGDYVYDTVNRRLYVYDTAASASWVDVSPDPLQVSVVGPALSANNNTITFDPNYLTALNEHTIFIGEYGSGLIIPNSTLVSRGPVSILPSAGGGNNISLSANQTRGLIDLSGTGSVINLGTSGIIAGTKTITLCTSDVKKFIIKNGSTSDFITVVSSSPSFEFEGGCVKVKHLVCTNDLVVEGSITTSSNTTLSSTSSVFIDITTVQTTPFTGLNVIDNNTVSNQWLCVMGGGNENPVFAAKKDSGSFVGINDSKRYNNSNFTVSGNQYYHGSNFTVATQTITLSSSVTVHGDLSATGDIVGFTTSDERLKNNVTPIANALKKLLALKGVEFDWATVDTMPRTGHDVGLIAQDVLKQVPEAVGTRHDGYYGVYYEKIIPLLVEAIRELDSKIK